MTDPTAPRPPGWHPDPEAPATLERYWDGTGWTDDSRPAGYVTQPAAPIGSPAGTFGSAPAPSGDPEEPRRRMTTAVVATALAVLAALVALVLVVVGVL